MSSARSAAFAIFGHTRVAELIVNCKVIKLVPSMFFNLSDIFQPCLHPRCFLALFSDSDPTRNTLFLFQKISEGKLKKCKVFFGREQNVLACGRGLTNPSFSPSRFWL